VVRSRFKNEGRVRPVVEGSEDESAEGSGVASGLSSMAFSESASGEAEEEEASVGLNLLMKGRRLRINGLVVLLLTSFSSVSDSSSSTNEAAVVDLNVASVLLNRLRKVGRFRVDPSSEGGVVRAAAISGFRSRLSSA
jgi:hypothetical protein